MNFKSLLKKTSDISGSLLIVIVTIIYGVQYNSQTLEDTNQIKRIGDPAKLILEYDEDLGTISRLERRVDAQMPKPRYMQPELYDNFFD